MYVIGMHSGIDHVLHLPRSKQIEISFLHVAGQTIELDVLILIESHELLSFGRVASGPHRLMTLQNCLGNR